MRSIIEYKTIARARLQTMIESHEDGIVWWFSAEEPEPPEPANANAPSAGPPSPFRERDAHHKWQPFMPFDRDRLEHAWLTTDHAECIVVRPDRLMQVDLVKMVMMPVYWPAAASVHLVRRASWYAVVEGGIPIPLAPELAGLIEAQRSELLGWLQSGSRNDAVENASHAQSPLKAPVVEKILALGGPLNEWTLVMRQGQLNAATVQARSSGRQLGALLWSSWTTTNSAPLPLGVPEHSSPSGATMALSSAWTSTGLSAEHKDALGDLSATSSLSPGGGSAFMLIRGYNEYVRLQRFYALKKPNHPLPPTPCTDSHSPASPSSPIPPTPQHLILVAHGIGQKFAGRFGTDIVKDVASLREKMWQKAVGRGNSPYEIAVLPIAWRAELNLPAHFFPEIPHTREDEAKPKDPAKNKEGVSARPKGSDNFDSMLQSITLTSVPAIRSLASDVALDMLLYMTPEHFNRILESIRKELIRVHALFMRHNPGFTGQISLIGHSLGSVLLCDLLAHFVDMQKWTPDAILQETMPSMLPFKVERLFALGSPLPLFMLLRHVKLIGTMRAAGVPARMARLGPIYRASPSAAVSLPKCMLLDCRQFYNIFHPFDPAAYRLEPLLVSPSARGMAGSIIEKPLVLPYGKKGLTKITHDVSERITRARQDLSDAFSSISLNKFWGRKGKTDGESAIEGGTAIADDDSRPAEQASAASSWPFDDTLLADLNDRRRVDFRLQDALLENSYVSAISAHFSYWTDEDIASFLVTELLSAFPASPVNQPS